MISLGRLVRDKKDRSCMVGERDGDVFSINEITKYTNYTAHRIMHRSFVHVDDVAQLFQSAR